MPAISIVAPVYGVEKYIYTFLDSIKNQSFQDLEVILVDDGSPDKCPAILDDFARQDARYSVIHQANAGVSMARNAGLKRASGEYVYIVDSDDWLEPDALKHLWEKARETGADIIYGDWVRESEGGSRRFHCFEKAFITEDRDVIERLHFALFSNSQLLKLDSPLFDRIQFMGAAPWRYMVKREVIAHNDLEFDPYVKGLGDDILFALHLYEHVGRIAYVREPIYHYRIAGGTYTHGYKADLIERYQLVYDRMESYLQTYHKNEFIWKGYYFRVLLYLNAAMDRYFKNDMNPKSERERYQEFRQLMQTSPYREMVQKADGKTIGSRRLKAYLALLKCSHYRLYWLLQK